VSDVGSPVTGGVQVRPVQYLVTVWPDGHDCPEAALWCLLVTCRGHGRWAVEQGLGYSDEKIVLTRSGQWKYDRPGDPGYRFSREEALGLARRHAAVLTIAGRTAVQVMRQHMETGCPG
jgi:hypothetical protein